VLEEWLGIEADLGSFAGDLAGEIEAFLAEPFADELTRLGALRFGALSTTWKARDPSEGSGYVHVHRT